MKNIFLVLNIVISLLVIFLILIQGKGGGLGSAWGGGELFQTRRGVEKFVFKLTVLFIIIFFVISLINFLLRK